MADATIIKTTLGAAAPVVAIINDRCYPLAAPDGVAAPFVVYTTASASPLNYVSGNTLRDSRRIQVDSYSLRYMEAVDLGKKVRSALEGLGYLVFEREDYEPETKLYRVQQDWSIHLAR